MNQLIAKLRKHVSLKGLINAFIFSCLYLVGWCLNKNIPSFFANFYRTSIFLMSGALYYLRYVTLHKYNFDLDKKGMPDRTREDLVLLGVAILEVTIALVAPYSDAADYLKLPDESVIRLIGLIMFIMSYVLMTVSIYTLKSNFTTHVTILDDMKLVTAGIFKYIRHPWYLGIIFYTYSIPLIFLSIAGLIISTGVIPLMLWRIKREEGLMKKAFGAEWDEYTVKSKRFIPFIY